jgi:hypothetical protein
MRGIPRMDAVGGKRRAHQRQHRSGHDRGPPPRRGPGQQGARQGLLAQREQRAFLGQSCGLLMRGADLREGGGVLRAGIAPGREGALRRGARVLHALMPERRLGQERVLSDGASPRRRRRHAPGHVPDAFGGARRNAQRAGDIGHFQPFHHAQHENVAAAIGKLQQHGL